MNWSLLGALTAAAFGALQVTGWWRPLEDAYTNLVKRLDGDTSKAANLVRDIERNQVRDRSILGHVLLWGGLLSLAVQILAYWRGWDA